MQQKHRAARNSNAKTQQRKTRKYALKLSKNLSKKTKQHRKKTQLEQTLFYQDLVTAQAVVCVRNTTQHPIVVAHRPPSEPLTSAIIRSQTTQKNIHPGVYN